MADFKRVKDALTNIQSAHDSKFYSPMSIYPPVDLTYSYHYLLNYIMIEKLMERAQNRSEDVKQTIAQSMNKSLEGIPLIHSFIPSFIHSFIHSLLSLSHMICWSPRFHYNTNSIERKAEWRNRTHTRGSSGSNADQLGGIPKEEQPDNNNNNTNTNTKH